MTERSGDKMAELSLIRKEILSVIEKNSRIDSRRRSG